ncbi:hypothetical protein [Enterovibrio nigricans]|uniref:Uncharacterized protein n=1 Tax=Enterovibrio nigricans DSM 22720 TaxID=1121868 RepID=A0A1T4UFT1_9GAMM|nr:hypothetical protein [Enterovibrio nigricans]PKF51074.1 hypothetical protein AT251_06595 [Enterovibrio nigricans]SKA51549.1 hypothetical protein SAMN02745132_01634 [Enterovibrio nigricans DSM 22720]
MNDKVKTNGEKYDLSQVVELELVNNYHDLLGCIVRANGDMPKDRSDWDFHKGTSRIWEVRHTDGVAQVWGVVEDEVEVLKLIDFNGESPNHSSDDLVFPNNE